MIYLIREYKDKQNGHRLREGFKEYIEYPANFGPFSAFGDEYLENHIEYISFEDFLNIEKTAKPDDCFFYVYQIRDPFITFNENFNLLDFIDNEDIYPYLKSGKIQILILLGLEEFDIFRVQDYIGVDPIHYKNYHKSTPIGIIEESLKKYDIKTEYLHYASPLFPTDSYLLELETLGLKTNINFYFYDSFANQYSDICAYYDPEINIETEKLYSCLCYGVAKPHRSDMVYSLWKNDLLKFGDVSIKELDGSYEKEFEKIIPLKLDGTANHHYKINDKKHIIEVEKKLLNDSFIYISCETHLPVNICYVTEKTWKAILHKKPFLIVGDNGSLQKLKEFGFKTFDKWWSEEYDYYNDEKTIEYVTYIINKLSKKTIEERIWWLTRPNAEGLTIEDVLEHNYETLKSFANIRTSEFLTQLHKNYQATSPYISRTSLTAGCLSMS